MDNPIGLLFYENMSLSPKTNNIQRTVYDFFGVCGDVGGIMQVFVAIAAFIMIPFNKFNLKLKAIQKLLKLKKKKKLEELSLLQRLRL